MTLVVAATGYKSIWLMTDRRISYADPRRKARDDARKTVRLETTDGIALLGYAGLGETPGQTEPSDWMGRVLRGWNLPLENSLGLLTEAINRKLPAPLKQLPSDWATAHHTIAPSFLNGDPRIYLISLVRPPGSNTHTYQYNRLVGRGRKQPQPFVVAGSGAPYAQRDRPGMKHLLRLIRAHDLGRIGERTVLGEFARFNYRISEAESTVGKRCVVCWTYQRGGGGNACFDGVQMDRGPDVAFIPTIAQGKDVGSLIKTIWQFMRVRTDPLGRPVAIEFDEVGRDAAIAKLPAAPDDRLA